VQTGATYTPLASNTISNMITVTDPISGVQTQAYAATLSRSGCRHLRTCVPISPLLPGTPPLVVQDGWAIVSATPTGFSFTDITGQIVLVSETTPPPVTAIAVDANPNVAYLALPGTN